MKNSIENVPEGLKCMDAFTNRDKHLIYPHYYLMNKNDVMLEFIEISYGNTVTFNIVPESISDICPWLPDISKFIDSRVVVPNRKIIESLFSNLGITSKFELVKATYGISLVDTFWIKSKNDKRTWESVSPYLKNHTFDLSWFFDKSSTIKRKLQFERPEYSTDGNFPKCWVTKNNEHYLIKCGSSGASNSGLEPFSEFYMRQLECALGIDKISVKCDLVGIDYSKFSENYKQSYGVLTNIDGILGKDIRVASLCKSFMSEDFGLVTAAQLGLFDYLSVLDFAESVSIDCREKVAKQLLLDSLSANTDRHFGNIGFLYDNSSFKIIDVAPIYDNNLSLMPGWLSSFPETASEYAEGLTPVEFKSFKALGQTALAEIPHLHESVKNIAEYFEFVQEGDINFKKERLENLSAVVRNLAKQVITP